MHVMFMKKTGWNRPCEKNRVVRILNGEKTRIERLVGVKDLGVNFQTEK